MLPSELYVDQKQIEAIKTLIIAQQTERKRKQHGIAALCGIVCGTLTNYWSAGILLNTFFGEQLWKTQAIQRLLKCHEKLQQFTPNQPWCHDFKTELIWTHQTNGEIIETIPNDSNKKQTVKLPWTRYTIYNQQQNYAYAFFIQKNTFTHQNKEEIRSLELHVHMLRVTSENKPNNPEQLWEYYVTNTAHNQPTFVLSAELRGFSKIEHFNKKETQCESNLVAENLFTQLEYLESLHISECCK